MFMSTRHQEGLAHLLYGINHGGGFVALTGEVGTGKTTICHCLLDQLPGNVDIALILNPKLNAVELLATICDDLRIAYDAEKMSLKTLVDALNRYLLAAHANNRRTVLIIDEAQNLNLEVLEQIRLLTNLETSKTKLLQIILVGQPELNDLLSRRELRQLNQRITARYHLLPLSLEETRIYIRHRLTVSKGDPDLFKESAIKKVFDYSGGIPRVINIICHCALLGAFSIDSRSVTASMVKRAAEETLGQRANSARSLAPLLTGLLLATLVFFYYYREPVLNRWIAQAGPVAANKHSVILNPKPDGVPSLAITRQKVSSGLDTGKFADLMQDARNDLPLAMIKGLNVWGKTDDGGLTDCKTVQRYGLQCFVKKGIWKDVADFNRPAILEFTLSDRTKRFALLTKIENGQPVFRFEQDRAYPLSEVMNIWDGYFLLLWQPPLQGEVLLYPGQSTPAVAWLRKQLTEIDGISRQSGDEKFFDAELKTRVIDFQKAKGLTADGKVGMLTFFYLDHAMGAKNSPHLKD